MGLTPVAVSRSAERVAEERRQSSIEVRNVDAADLGWMGSQSGKPNPEQHFWFRSRAPIKPDSEFQKCVLAYASDMQFIGTAARAAGLGAFTKPRLGMLASLDHTMYFYDDGMDASEWLLFTMSSPALSHGRGLVSGGLDGVRGPVFGSGLTYSRVARRENLQEGRQTRRRVPTGGSGQGSALSEACC